MRDQHRVPIQRQTAPAFGEVARQVAEDLRRGPEYYPPGLSLPEVEIKWDHDLLIELAKTSFRSCKAQWRGQMDEEVAKKEAANRKNPKSVLELIHEQLMSDEASGQEETDMRGPAARKTRMSFKAGLGDLSDAELAKRAFFEVLDVPWRSELETRRGHPWLCHGARTQQIPSFRTDTADSEQSGAALPVRNTS
ncbi:hypothetical protein B0H13DRAFT_2383523 [Mycena leptocephala]|nr:hypothetical protein B0H13DRAFT_2383523 [Mycena leptocephala]